MDTTKRELDEVLEAIKDSGAIKTVIAQRLGVTRQTVDNYLSRWKTAQAAYEDEKEINLDLAESVVISNIRTAVKIARSGEVADSGDAWRYLKTKGVERGYSERQQIDLRHFNLSDLTTEELEELATKL